MSQSAHVLRDAGRRPPQRQIPLRRLIDYPLASQERDPRGIVRVFARSGFLPPAIRLEAALASARKPLCPAAPPEARRVNEKQER